MTKVAAWSGALNCHDFAVLHAVWGIGDTLSLAPVVDHFVLSVAPTAPQSRLWDPGAALRAAHSAGWSAEVVSDFDKAIERAASTGATVLVTGSFHTVGDAMARLQAAPAAG